MNKKKLGDIAEFTSGKNPTRLKSDEILIYSKDDFEKDLICSNEIKDFSRCIIDLTSSMASPISVQSEKKYITSNYIKLEFDPNILDVWYLCYSFNEGKDLPRQIVKYNQGTTQFVQKLNAHIIKELELSIYDMNKQKMIGELYKKSLRQNYLLMKQAEQLKMYTKNIIRKIEVD
jgi:hypothetical protein